MPKSRLNICDHAALAAYSDFATGVLAILGQLGLGPVGSSPAEFTRLLAAQVKTMRLAGIQPE